MKKLLFVCLPLIFMFCACTYHGQIRAGIYQKPDYKDKINARVMVVADKSFLPEYNLEADDTYIYRLSNGLPIAVADALATLFTEVEVNEYQYRQNYDFIVEIDYHALTYMKVEHYVRQRAIFSRNVAEPYLISSLTLTVRNPHTDDTIAHYEASQDTRLEHAKSNTLLWTTSFLRTVTLGLLTPLDMQVFGNKLRTHLEEDITAMLSQTIMPQMREDSKKYQHNTLVTQPVPAEKNSDLQD